MADTYMSPSPETRETREFASEIKFLVEPAVAAAVKDWARASLSPDPYAAGAFGDEYHTRSLYFDTEQFDVFYRRGSFGRSKYRVRRYGASEVAFLERKLRTSDLVSKRRTIVPLEDLPLLEEPGLESAWPGRWFHQRLLARRLQPICQVAYDRTARVGMTDFGPIRLTLDDNIRAVPVEGLDFDASAATPVNEGKTVLEFKYRIAMPAVFKRLAEEFSLSSEAVSKYRMSAAALGLLDPSTEQPVTSTAPGAECPTS
jgi:VTC domain